MKLHRLWSALSVLTVVSAQTTSGLSFDSRDDVRLVWGFEGTVTTRYDFWLCAGDETTGEYEPLEKVIEYGIYAPGDWVSFRVDQGVGGNGLNAYFLKIVPSTKDNSLSGFTSHFTLTNMKGSFSSKVVDAIQSMQPSALTWSRAGDSNLIEAERVPHCNDSTLNIEDPIEPFKSPTPTIANDIEHELRKRLDPHIVPYGEQTGLTRYAPAPKRAGTTIPPANKTPTPQFPPFPFTIATTYLPAPTVQYTDNAASTWTDLSIENTAAPAAAPTLNKRMQDWMERVKH
ncbi:hypothetical protein N7495_008844 [Penicillium taxi]|uniref:uncharacterized protein n=1 Tax=Penicillium taxi TaxID=168475 RepID=UPI002544F3D8|nr:uncharacterized protein N7495_008844 [Penicillium taxi]KAJ5888803.1 hypothetical protein N7495_008844 [Penicillium taxi]